MQIVIFAARFRYKLTSCFSLFWWIWARKVALRLSNALHLSILCLLVLLADHSTHGKQTNWVEKVFWFYLHVSEIYALLSSLEQRRHFRATITLLLAGWILNWIILVAWVIMWDNNRFRLILWDKRLISLCKLFDSLQYDVTIISAVLYIQTLYLSIKSTISCL